MTSLPSELTNSMPIHIIPKDLVDANTVIFFAIGLSFILVSLATMVFLKKRKNKKINTKETR